MLPAKVLARARQLAEESRAEDQLKNLAGRRIWSLVAAIIVLLILNGANAFVFGKIASSYLQGTERWISVSAWICSLIVGLGGVIMMFNALVAWLEVVVFQQANPLVAVPKERLRFYRRSTWWPLVPLSLFPALFNAWFSVTFFVTVVSFLLVLVIFSSLLSDV